MSSATLLSVAIILTVIVAYPWAARFGVFGTAQRESVDRYWQGALGMTALAAGFWLAWLTL